MNIDYVVACTKILEKLKTKDFLLAGHKKEFS